MIEVYKYTHGLFTTNPNLIPINQESVRRGHKLRLSTKQKKKKKKKVVLVDNQ